MGYSYDEDFMKRTMDRATDEGWSNESTAKVQSMIEDGTYLPGKESGEDSTKGSLTSIAGAVSPLVPAVNAKGKAEKAQNDYKDWRQTSLDDLKMTKDDIAGRSFSYDYMSDPLYQMYREQYMADGQRAMKDAMAESAILTGGYGNSWAQSAGQQAYDYYMSKLNDIIPELRAAAYSEWRDDLEDDVWAYNESVSAFEEEDEQKRSELDELWGDYDEIVAGNEAYLAQVAADKEAEAEAARGRAAFEAELIEQGISNPTLLGLYIAANEDFAGLGEEEIQSIIDDVTQKVASMPKQTVEKEMPDGKLMEEAAELYFAKGYDGIIEWASKYPEYDAGAAFDHAVTKYGDKWDVDEDADGNITTKEKKLKDRTWTETDDGGWNWFGGLDNNAWVEDQYGNEFSLGDLAKALHEEGAFETVDDAKDWIIEQGYGKGSWGIWDTDGDKEDEEDKEKK